MYNEGEFIYEYCYTCICWFEIMHYQIDLPVTYLLVLLLILLPDDSSFLRMLGYMSVKTILCEVVRGKM